MAALLALVAAACWGGADFFAGLRSRRTATIIVVFGSQALGILPLLVIVGIEGVPIPPPDIVLTGIATGLGTAAGFFVIYTVLASGDMARVAPILATEAAIPVVVGVAAGDQPSGMQAGGMAAASLGVILVSTESAVVTGPQRDIRPALALALAGAAIMGISLVGLDRTADYDPFWALLMLRVTIVAVMGAAAMVTSQSGEAMAALRDLPLALLGAVELIGTMLWVIASTQGLLSVVAVLGTTFPTFTVLLALLLLHERLDRTQAVGVVATLGGSAVITVG